MPLTNPAASVIRVLLSGGLPNLAIDYPFVPGLGVTFQTAGVSNLYAASLPGDQGTKRFSFKLAANLGNAELDVAIPSNILAANIDNAGLDAAVDPTVLTVPGASAGIAVLRAVVIRDAGPTVLRRRGQDVADGSLSADSFKVKTAGTSIRIRGPAAGSYKAGETFTVILLPTTDILGLGGVALGTQLNANRLYEDVSYPLVYAVCAANEEVNIRAALPG